MIKEKRKKIAVTLSHKFGAEKGFCVCAMMHCHSTWYIAIRGYGVTDVTTSIRAKKKTKRDLASPVHIRMIYPAL